jgi:cytoskeletal protein RodZ
MSLGKELASIRKSKNLTLEDIQNAVKIPLETLKSIENDRIFSDSSRNKTYVRSFVRSYAKYLKIEDEVIVKALDEIYAGTYSGSLYDDSEETEPTTADFQTEEEFTETSKIPSEETEKTEKPAPKPVKPQPVQDDMDSINWADMGRKFTTASKSSKAWVIIIFVVVFGLLAASGYIFWDDINEFINNATTQTEQPADTGVESEALIPNPGDSVVTEPDETQTASEQSEDNPPTEQNQPEPEPI